VGLNWQIGKLASWQIGGFVIWWIAAGLELASMGGFGINLIS
jgi:hypothetical protein